MKDEKDLPWSPRHRGCCCGWYFIPGFHADRRIDLCVYLSWRLVCRLQGPACEGLSTVRSHRLQPAVGHLAPITIKPIIPQFTSICLPDLLLSPVWSNKAKSTSQTQEKCAPLKWLKVYQKHSPGVWLQAITNTSTELSDHLCAKNKSLLSKAITF